MKEYEIQSVTDNLSFLLLVLLEAYPVLCITELLFDTSAKIYTRIDKLSTSMASVLSSERADKW